MSLKYLIVTSISRLIYCLAFHWYVNRLWRKFLSLWRQIFFLVPLQRLDCSVVPVFTRTQRKQLVNLLSQYYCLWYLLWKEHHALDLEEEELLTLLLHQRHFSLSCDYLLLLLCFWIFLKAETFFQVRSTISPALEAAIDYQLKILSVCITYGGPALLRYKDQFKEAVFLAFDSPSWKVFFFPCLYFFFK